MVGVVYLFVSGFSQACIFSHLRKEGEWRGERPVVFGTAWRATWRGGCCLFGHTTGLAIARTLRPPFISVFSLSGHGSSFFTLWGT